MLGIGNFLNDQSLSSYTVITSESEVVRGLGAHCSCANTNEKQGEITKRSLLGCWKWICNTTPTPAKHYCSAV